jgi:hypothetical protein
VREEYALGEETPKPLPIGDELFAKGREITRRCLGVEDTAGILPLHSATDLLLIDCLQPRFSNVEEAVAQSDRLRSLVSAVFPETRYLSFLPEDARERWDEASVIARTAEVTLLVTRNACLVQDQAQLAKAVWQASPRLIHLAARNPHDITLTPGATHLMTYGDQPLGLQSAIDRLAGR